MTTLLEQAFNANEFSITAELVPPVTVEPQRILDEVLPIAEQVTAINVTDAAAAKTTLGSLGACAILAQNGVEPVLQLACRDRNRIALASDLMSAAALGIHNVLTITGDDPSKGDQPEAMPVFDLNSAELLAVATQMRDAGLLPGGRAIDPPPHLYLGTTDVPVDPGPDWSPAALEKKSAAGAQFVQTQFCFDTELTRRYVDALVESGITKKMQVILGVGPILSAKSARWMHDNLYGVSVPHAVIERLEAAADPKAEGQRLCAELIATYREWEGVGGVHIMAPAQSCSAIAKVLELV